MAADQALRRCLSLKSLEEVKKGRRLLWKGFDVKGLVDDMKIVKFKL